MSDTGKFAILYVDDEWSNRTVFEANFSDRFRIVTTGSGEEALEILKREPIACLITDQRMPGMSGNELLKRAKELHPATIRVVVTAYDDPDPILRALNDQLVARYIVKPWRKEELDETLSWAVGAFSMGRESAEIQLRLLKSERLITLGGISSSLLHEIRNLLSAPKTNAKYLRDAAKHSGELATLVESRGDALTPPAREAFTDLAVELPAVCRDSLESFQKIDDVLESFRGVLKENAAGGLRRADPKRAIRCAMVLLSPGAAAVELVQDAPERLPDVEMNETELTQVLVNAGLNALQAFAPDTHGRVTILATEDDASVHFAVTDDGPGMPPEVLARIGSFLFSTKAEGTGLGVSACRRLVARAGGELLIESTVGKGTTVRFSVKKA